MRSTSRIIRIDPTAPKTLAPFRFRTGFQPAVPTPRRSFFGRATAAASEWVHAQGFYPWAAIISLLAVVWLVTTDYLLRLAGTAP